jgi:hypothetical protein
MSDSKITDFADPANHQSMWELASRMHDILSEGVLSGYGPADLAAAVAMLNGLYLAGPYDKRRDMRVAMEAIGRAAITHAERAQRIFKRIPMDHRGRA